MRPDQNPRGCRARTVLDEVRRACPGCHETAVRSLLGRFLFSGDDVFKRLGQISGGEQSRVRLITLILSSPTMLVLDEPTNHLDIASREALEAALDDFPGTIITVSHDRYFLDRIVDRLLLLRDGTHAMYAGDYSFYIEQIEAADEARTGAKAGNRRGAVRSKSSKPNDPFARLTLDEIEALIADRERQLAEISMRYADPAVYKDPAEVVRLGEQFESVKRELAAAEEAWLGRAET